MLSDERMEWQLSTLKNCIIRLEDFRIDRVIGSGGYGEVYHAVHIHSGIECAVKRLEYEELKGTALKYFLRELQVLVQCKKSQFLLPFMGFTNSLPFSIVTEYIPRGSLADALNGIGNITPTQMTLIALGIAEGMKSLHASGIIHRDMKTANVLLDENTLPKICDFGVSCFKTDSYTTVTRKIGTTNWMAPEVFNTTNYTDKVDVYSYGLVLWSMVTGKTPWYGCKMALVITNVCKRGERPLIPANTPRGLRRMIEQCWSQDPNERPTFNQIVEQFRSGEVYFADTNKNEFEKGLELMARLAKEDRSDPLRKPRSRKSDIGDSSMTSVFAADGMPIPKALPAAKGEFSIEEQDWDKSLFEEYEPYDDPFSDKLILGLIVDALADDRYVESFINSGSVQRLNFALIESYEIAKRVLEYNDAEYRKINWERVVANVAMFGDPVLHLFSRIVNIKEAPFRFLYESANKLIECGLTARLYRILMARIQIDDENKEVIRHILQLGLYSRNTEGMSASIKALCQFDDLSFVNSDIVKYHVHNNEKRMMSIIVRQKPDPFFIPFVKSVLKKSSTAVAIMCGIAELEEGAKILLSDLTWIDSPNVLPVIMVLVKKPENRKPIINYPSFAYVLGQIAEKHDSLALEVITTLLAGEAISEETANRMCEEKGFLQEYVKWLVEKASDDVLRSAIELLSILTNGNSDPIVFDVIPKIKVGLELCPTETLLLLSKLPHNPESRQLLNDNSIAEVLSRTEVEEYLNKTKESVIAWLTTE